MTLPLILDWTLRGSVLVALAAAGVAIWRRSTAAHRHFVWTLAMGGLLVLPVLSFALPWRLPVIPGLSNAPATITPVADVAPVEWRTLSPDWTTPTPTPTASAAASASASASADASPTPQAWPTVDWSAPVAAAEPAAAQSSGSLLATLIIALRWMWIAGIALAIGRVIVGVLALRWVTRDSRPISERGWLELLASTCERLDLRVPVQLLESPHANMPMAFGLLHPIVVLPMENDTWSAERREVVLLHELAHVRRMDVRANLVSQLACALYWFNPLVWVAARRLRIEAERACDDLVLGAGAGASAYAGHLLEMVQSAASLRAPAFAVPMAQPSAFEGRVLAILDPKVARHGVTRRSALFGVLTLFAVTVPLAALAPVQNQHEERDRQRERRREEQARHELEVVRMQQIAMQASAHINTDVSVRLEREAALEMRATRESERVTERMTEQAARIAAQADREREHQQRSDPRVIQGLLVALQDSDTEVRMNAAHALGDRGDTAAINALLNALRRDTSKDVRKTAAWALGEIEDARAVPGLLATLQSERDTEVRNTIAWALGEIESADAVQGIAAALQREEDQEIRRTLVWALGEIESADAVPVLSTLIRDSDPELRSKVAWAFGEIESAAAIEPLSAMFNAERLSSVRAQIVWALGEIEDARGAPMLEAALRDTSVEVRRNAAHALGELDGLRSAPAGLIAAMRDSDVEVRRMAVHSAGELEDPATVPGLITAMRDDDLEVRRLAVHALGEIPGTQAIEALVAALRDTDPEIRRAAAQALGNK